MFEYNNNTMLCTVVLALMLQYQYNYKYRVFQGISTLYYIVLYFNVFTSPINLGLAACATSGYAISMQPYLSTSALQQSLLNSGRYPQERVEKYKHTSAVQGPRRSTRYLRYIRTGLGDVETKAHQESTRTAFFNSGGRCLLAGTCATPLQTYN